MEQIASVNFEDVAANVNKALGDFAKSFQRLMKAADKLQGYVSPQVMYDAQISLGRREMRVRDKRSVRR